MIEFHPNLDMISRFRVLELNNFGFLSNWCGAPRIE